MFRIGAMLRKAGAGGKRVGVSACGRIGVWRVGGQADRRATGHIRPIGPIGPIRGTRYRGTRLDTTPLRGRFQKCPSYLLAFGPFPLTSSRLGRRCYQPHQTYEPEQYCGSPY